MQRVTPANVEFIVRMRDSSMSLYGDELCKYARGFWDRMTLTFFFRFLDMVYQAGRLVAEQKEAQDES